MELTAELFEKIEAAFDDAGAYGTFRTYSGRGMYGQYCLGFVPERDQKNLEILCRAMYVLGGNACLEDNDDNSMGETYISSAYRELSHVSMDSMGLSSILYFPWLTIKPDSPLYNELDGRD